MLVLDIEASGTDYSKHSIVSLGAVDLRDPTYRLYEECRVWDGAHIMDEALAVNGFSKEEVTDPTKQDERALIEVFYRWVERVEDRTLAGQNVSFDRDFLKAASDRANIAWPLAHRTIDTHTLCFMHMVKRGITPPFDKEQKRSALNLDAVMQYCGIPEEPQPHNALTGALSHAEVISRLLYNKPLLEEFSEFPMPW